MERSENNLQNLRPLVIIAGPTASGKSSAAVALAGALNGAVISADSMQVYKGMDIGSAKIRADEMEGIPHYLIDIIEPDEEWNVVRFQQETKKALEEIYSRGQIPILCGGTGFYIQSILYDIDFTQTKSDSSFRSELQHIADTKGPETLHAMLRKIDPVSADTIHPNNVKRVIRAIEYARETGGRISEHNEEEHRRPQAYNAAFFVLTMDRIRLYDRIDLRVDKMFEEGLPEEVASLKSRGFTDQDVSMQGLGYKEILRALDGRMTLDEAREKIKLETRHFAKRQLTWFKREPSARWINVDDFHDKTELNRYILEKTEEILHVYPKSV